MFLTMHQYKQAEVAFGPSHQTYAVDHETCKVTRDNDYVSFLVNSLLPL